MSYWLRLSSLLVAGAALMTACDDPTSPVDPNNPPVSNCIDADGDGYGENCDLGVDCDDNDPLRALSCEAANDAGPVITPPDHCAPGARLPGCPCAGTEEPVDCYDGAGETKKRKRRGAKQLSQAWRRRETARRDGPARGPASDAHGAG